MSLPTLTYEQWQEARNRMCPGFCEGSPRMLDANLAMDRAFGPCPIKPVPHFELVTEGGSTVFVKDFDGWVLLGIARGDNLIDTSVSKGDLRRIAEACLEARS